MRTCTKCGESKPLNQFSKSNDRPSGLHSQCKQCKKVSKSRPKVYGSSVTRGKAIKTTAKMKTVVRYGKDVADVIDSLSSNDDYSRGW